MIKWYTAYEGGEWLPWPIHAEAQHIPAELEKMRLHCTNYSGKVILIHGIYVHSFKTGLNTVWDVANGWRKV